MDNIRSNKVNRLLQRELGELFRLQTSALHGVLISVTSVRVSPDLSIAHVRLSIFPNDKAEELLKAIKENTVAIRYDLGQRVKNQLRKLPDLSFHIDDSLSYLERIDELLKR